MSPTEDQQYILPLQANFFCQIKKYNYPILYLYQMIFISYVGFWGITSDNLIFGFIIRVHHQLALLSSRIQKLPENINLFMDSNTKATKLHAERKFLAEIIKQHQQIYE